MGGGLRYEGVDAQRGRIQMVRWLADQGYQRTGHLSGTLRDQSYRVPHDLAVVGCVDILDSTVVRPRPTTIRRNRQLALERDGAQRGVSLAPRAWFIEKEIDGWVHGVHHALLRTVR